MKSSIVCPELAPSSWLIAGRIGSTSPIPMKEMAQAKAIAQTAVGCRRIEALRGVAARAAGRAPPGLGTGTDPVDGWGSVSVLVMTPSGSMGWFAGLGAVDAVGELLEQLCRA